MLLVLLLHFQRLGWRFCQGHYRLLLQLSIRLDLDLTLLPHQGRCGDLLGRRLLLLAVEFDLLDANGPVGGWMSGRIVYGGGGFFDKEGRR